MTKPSPGKHSGLLSAARPLVLALVSTLVCALLLSGAYLLWQNQARTRLQGQVLKDVSQLRGTMERVLNANLHLTVGLAAFVTTHPDLSETEFSAFASRLLESSNHVVNNFTYSPGHIIRYVHPLEGNEAAIGAVLRTHPDFAPTVEALNRTAAPILAGPHRLIQGGEALIAREPLIDQDPETGLNRVWGQVSMPMDVALFYQQTGVGEFATRYELSIRGRDGRGAGGEVFYGDPRLFHSDPIRQQVTFPGGVWEIGARPHGGWAPRLPTASLIAALSLLIAVFMISYRMSHKALLLRHSEARANQAEQALKISHNRYRELTDAVQQVVFETDHTGAITYINTAWEAYSCHGIQTIKGQPWTVLLHSDDRAELQGHFNALLEGRQARVHHDARIQSLQGVSHWIHAQLIPRVDHRGEITGAIGTLLDITQRKRSEEAIRHQALHDPLTGLPNRILLIERLKHAISVTQRLGKTLALLSVDLDNFKPVNDRYGHAAGDQVLCEIGRRLKSLIRGADTVARMGGDEFIVLLESIEDCDGVHVVADKLLSALTEPIEIEAQGRRIACRVETSIGIALARNQSIDVDTLLQQADEALYAAKAAGRGCIAPGSGIG